MSRKHRSCITVLIACVVLLAQPPLAFGSQAGTDDASHLDLGDPSAFLPDQIIITYGAGSDLSGLDGLSEGITLLDGEYDDTEVAVVALSEDVDVEEAIEAALSEPGVIAAQPDFIYSCLDTPNDPDLTDNPSGWWWLERIEAYAAWDDAKVNGSVTVAVLDSGLDIYHEDLVDNLDLAHAWDAFIEQPLVAAIGKDPSDYCGEFSPTAHGTHITGVIAAMANNGRGGLGVSYNAMVLPIRVYNSSMTSSTSVLVRAFTYLTDLRTSQQVPGLKVVNMSFGTPYNPSSPDSALHNKIIEASDAGILSVAAAGNGNRSDIIYPSDWPEVFSVISTTSDDTKSATSDYGPLKDICAPGMGVRSTTWSSSYPADHSSYALKSGTSVAAATVAGLTALVWSVNPALSVDAVKQIIVETADQLGPDSGGLEGFGRVNARQAVLEAHATLIEPPPPPPPPPPGDEPLDGFYNIGYGPGGSLVLDVRGASVSNMAAITIYADNNTVAQVFQLIYDQSDGCYVIKNPYSGKVIDVPGGNAYQGADIWQWQPNGLDCQKWRLLENPDGSYRIVTKLNDNLCLDIPGGQRTPGLQTRLWGCNDTSAQRFYLSDRLESRVPAGVYSIALAASPNMVVDVLGESLADSANINLWTLLGNNAQRFNISFDQRYGMYQIVNVGSNKAVDVCGVGYASGTNVWQWHQNGLLSQRWHIESTNNGSLAIYASHSGMALDAQGGRRVNGTNIWAYAPNGTDAQRWVLLPS